MATLDYSSVEHWMELGAKIVRWFDENKHLLDLNTERDCFVVFRKIAQEAKDMAFDLKQGHRVLGAWAIAQQLDDRLVQYYSTHHDKWKHDRSWLDVTRTKKQKGLPHVPTR